MPERKAGSAYCFFSRAESIDRSLSVVQRMLSNVRSKAQTCQSVADALALSDKKLLMLIDSNCRTVGTRWRGTPSLEVGCDPIILISGYDPAAVALSGTVQSEFTLRLFPITSLLPKEFDWELELSVTNR
jgi:hypothetical protein